jgi:hypothetical protein
VVWVIGFVLLFIVVWLCKFHVHLGGGEFRVWSDLFK